MRRRKRDGNSPSWEFEESALLGGATRIAGIDEAGRGPLAGPVVAAAVVLPFGSIIPGLTDSKQLTEADRERLFTVIHEVAIGTGIGIVSSRTIDKLNILQATRMAMAQAVRSLNPLPDYLLVDGPIHVDVPIRQHAVIKGDQRSFSVAAASVLAKVTRDRIMRNLGLRFPQYGFERHKGYGTREHRQAIARYGPTPEHRVTFRGVRETMRGEETPVQRGAFSPRL